MTKDDLIRYGLISFAAVIGARFFSNALFAWVEDFLFKKSKDEKVLDDLIKSKTYELGGGIRKPSTVTSKTQQLEHTIDPLELKKKEIMRRVFDLDLRKNSGESTHAYHLRILGLKTKEAPEQLKKAFKQRAKEFHPDMFSLNEFDLKVKRKLEKRIHENYLAVQKAYEFLVKG